MIARRRIDRLDGRCARCERIAPEKGHQQLAVRIGYARRNGLAGRWTERREERVRNVRKLCERGDLAGRYIDLPNSITAAIGHVELIADSDDAERIGKLHVTYDLRMRKGHVVRKIRD